MHVLYTVVGREIAVDFCNNHWGVATEHCVQRSYMGMRVFFWLLGLIGMCVLCVHAPHSTTGKAT